MFPSRYFADRYWAARYWAKVGEEIVTPPGGAHLIYTAYVSPNLHATAGQSSTLVATANVQPGLVGTVEKF